jgi:hypothetical protein
MSGNRFEKLYNDANVSKENKVRTNEKVFKTNGYTFSPNINDNIKRKDLDLILEVNRKAIELETEAVEQNEEIIKTINENKAIVTKSDEKMDLIIKSLNQLDKDLFKLQVLFITGIFAICI